MEGVTATRWMWDGTQAYIAMAVVGDDVVIHSAVGAKHFLVRGLLAKSTEYAQFRKDHTPCCHASTSSRARRSAVFPIAKVLYNNA